MERLRLKRPFAPGDERCVIHGRVGGGLRLLQRRQPLLGTRRRWQVAPVAVLGREVVDVAPVVLQEVHLDGLEVAVQAAVGQIVTAKAHIGGALHNRARTAQHQGVAVVTVARPKLTADDGALAASAVADEVAPDNRADKYAAVDAIVDGDLRHGVKQVDVAVLTAVQHKLLAIDGPRLPDLDLPLQPHIHVVLGIRPLALLPGVLLVVLLRQRGLVLTAAQLGAQASHRAAPNVEAAGSGDGSPGRPCSRRSGRTAAACERTSERARVPN
mmetsp:Transcript_45545/g.118015  ORF Transcript_45545/g.118015 Transcript_45545/m.118015 type:complete len:271 (+) Transcript_45545:659-1471(+)